MFGDVRLGVEGLGLGQVGGWQLEVVHPDTHE